MASRKDFFFRQKVTEAELDAAFAYMEQADWNQNVDQSLVGILTGLTVAERGAGANLTVDIAAGRGYTKLGERILVGALQNFDVSVDKDAVSTAVAGGGNSKILSVFVKFKRSTLDPRTDGNNNTVYFDQPETFEFKLIQSAEAGAPTPPAVQPDWILLADITRAFGQATIVNANISHARAEKQFVVAGAPRALSDGKIKDALTSLLTFYNNHVSGAADQHAATALTAAIAALWADGTGIAGATVDAALEEIVTDLAGVAGANKVGAGVAATWRDASGIAGATVDAVLEEIVTDLALQTSTAVHGAGKVGAFAQTVGSVTVNTGSVGSQILDLVTALNSHLTDAVDAHLATAIGAAIAATWRDATGIAGTTVDAALEEIVSDLASMTASVAGARKVGQEGIASAPNSIAAGSLHDAFSDLLSHINNHLNDATDAHDASAISYIGSGNWADATAVTAANVESALDEVVSDLAATGGAGKIGAAIAATWADATGIAGATVDAALEEIVTDLAASTGARKIGTEASLAFSAEALDVRLDNLELIAAGYYGDGSGGTSNISSGTTVQTDDTNYDSLTISGTGILEPDSFIVLVQGALTMTASTIRCLGANASGTSPGLGGTSIVLGTGTQGGAPGAGVGGNGSSNVTSGVGGEGGPGGLGSGGAGGTGGTNGISITFAASAFTHLPQAALQQFTSGTGINVAGGGTGGGAGGGDGVGTEAGAGGAGGGCMVIRAMRIVWTAGSISARGGDGGNAVGTNCGGGGGGGGGFITLIFRWETGARNTIVTGGSGGTKTGTGIAGTAGSVGRVVALAA